MLVSDLEIYESWNLKLPLLPKRSKLYHLEPIAVGTAYVEGLISYVCRLAEAHCVSPGVLTKQEILPSLRSIYTVGSRKVYKVREDGAMVSVLSFSKPVNNKNANEQGFWAWQYIEGLEPLTIQTNLQALTIPRWVEQIAHLDTESKIARDLRAWCPECFRQWRSNNQVVYEPLLWSIAAVIICPHHCQPLQMRCPHCDKIQRPITGGMQVGRCSQCLKWLDIRSQKDVEAEDRILSEVEWHLWVVERLIEVLAVKPNLPASKTREQIGYEIEAWQKVTTHSANCSIKETQWQLLKVLVN